MKFDTEIPNSREGVFVPVPFAGPNQIVQVAQGAERLGFHAVWGTDFMTPTSDYGMTDSDAPNWHEPLITLAYCAALTERIKLGTGVILLPFRDPVILAKQVATLDRFSNGRLLLGVGLGFSRKEFEAIRPRSRGARRGTIMDEHLAVLHLLLSHDGKAASFEGRYTEIQGVALDPKPVQNPLPIYLAGQSDPALERVARWGAGMLVPAAQARTRMDALKPVLEEHGRDISEIDIVAAADLTLARTHKAAVARYRASRAGQFKTRGSDFESAIAGNWIGTTADVAEKIGATKEQGITHFRIANSVGETVTESLEQMHMFAEEIIPRVT